MWVNEVMVFLSGFSLPPLSEAGDISTEQLWGVDAVRCCMSAEPPRRRAAHEGRLAPLGSLAWLLFLLRTDRGSTRGFVGHSGNAGSGALLPHLVSDEAICTPRHGTAACSLFPFLSRPGKAGKSLSWL